MVLYYLLLSQCLYLCYSTIFQCLLPAIWYSTNFYLSYAYTFGTLLSSAGSLLIPMVLYCLLLSRCLYLWYSTDFQWPLPIPLVVFYLLLAQCLYYCALLSSTGCLLKPFVLYFLLMVPCLSLCLCNLYHLLLPSFLYLWYSTTFYWLPAYTFGTLLPSAGSLPIPLTL